MSTNSTQLGLFDTEPSAGQVEESFARARMTETIRRLKAASVPPWTDQIGIILEDGAFQRAMRLVPGAEAQALWIEFDAEMERLCAGPAASE